MSDCSEQQVRGGSELRVSARARCRSAAALALLLLAPVAAGCSAHDEKSTSPSSVTSSSARAASDAKPEILSIPSVNLTSGLKPEGLRGGKVNPAAGEVIWYTGHNRVMPGSKGTAVIAGHVANGSKPDVFAPLEEVRVGEKVSLTAEDGSTATFTIKRAAVVDKQALTKDRDVWGKNTSVKRVVLITCDDELGFRKDGHRKANFVVVAESS